MIIEIMKSSYTLCLLLLFMAAVVWAQDFVDESSGTASNSTLEAKQKDNNGDKQNTADNKENNNAAETETPTTRGISLGKQQTALPVLPQDAVRNSQEASQADADSSHIAAITTEASPMQKPILFNVGGKVKKAWLFGTMHVPDPRISTLSPELQAALDASDVVLTEARMDLFTETYMQAAIMRTDNQSLKTVLPPNVQADLSHYLRGVNFGGTIDNLNHMKVWAVYASISVLKKQLQYPGIVPIDTTIYRTAVDTNKIADGIETVEEQVRHLENFSEQEQITLLAETLQMLKKDQQENHDSMEEMLQWYLQGAQTDLKTLMAHILPENRDRALEDKFMQTMFYERNHTMAKRIAQHFQKAPEKTYFIAVGAGHLSGEHSIQDHLRQYGYTVERAP